ncbi:signal recognition particle, SRP19 subunit [Aulographum hederae CBS 113979]|uniref:Signal recognition particle, SRP19 subunit n=1 Tax=Aulographum hederae CBS 113979 TaxID=1176131 RepID=A0A6G1GZJ3_9PEZI|nr:signal recognition particle, SRP19 subunit [Aulographum hederae CBS 113979]
MSRHAQIEELSDSDPSEMDPTDFEPLPSNTIIAPADIPSTSSSSSTQQRAPPTHLQPQNPNTRQTSDRSFAKTWSCLYPLYFDSSRTRAQGRRVGKELATENPLAHTIAQAVASCGMRVAFEPDKTHPKDWGNPGRVRVCMRNEGGGRVGGVVGVKNKAHLYIHVAKYLKDNPTTPDMPMQLPIGGMPLPKEPLPPPATPKGWKLNTILPLHSPAVTGGGVSENFMKDMMAEMGADVGGSSGGGDGKPKKVKRKIIRG